MALDGTPRILITRLSAIGDCVLTMPVLCALRRAFPEARLTWMVQAPGAQLLQGHDCLDDVIVVPRRWLKSPSQILKLRRQMRARAFDYAVDPQSLAKSGLLAWLSGARLRIGFAPPLGRETSHWLYNVRVTPQSTHIVTRQLELLAPLGIDSPDVEFRLPPFDAATALVREQIRALVGTRYAVLNVGAAWPSKQWPHENFSEIARHIGRRHGLPTIAVWGNELEKPVVERVCQLAHGHAVPSPFWTLPELACALRGSRLVVASDTGPLHMAAAVGTPCVGLYGPTRPCDSGPFGASHITVQAYYQSGTSRERRAATNDAMQAISVDQVQAACDEILSRQSATHAA